MSDPLRTDTSLALEAVSAAERDAKIEQILLAGLDHYFAARYDQAINVWTRALFFDRNHARARAYIERARSALAEGQRESEEMLQSGLAAFGRGDTGAARSLLQSAIDRGAPADEALAVLGRLDRLEQGQSPHPDQPAAPGDADESPAVSDHRRPWRGAVIVTIAVASTIAVGSVLATSRGWLDWPEALRFPAGGPAAQAAPPFIETAPELPRRGEMALVRARQLAASGRLRDALAVLERVRPTDPERGDADRLRAEVQKQLLALVRLPPAVNAAGAAGQPRQP
jgi:tetratricopeptide (TPR) repeat protein